MRLRRLASTQRRGVPGAFSWPIPSPSSKRKRSSLRKCIQKAGQSASHSFLCTQVFRERGRCQDPATRLVPASLWDHSRVPFGQPPRSGIFFSLWLWSLLWRNISSQYETQVRLKFFQGWSVSENRWLAYWAKIHNIVFSWIQKPPRVSSVHRHTVSFAGPLLGPLKANPKAISLNASALGSETNLVFVVFPDLFGLWWFGNGNAQLQCGNQSGGGNHLHSHTQRFPSQGYL